jgi:hypothetical protein
MYNQFSITNVSPLLKRINSLIARKQAILIIWRIWIW